MLQTRAVLATICCWPSLSMDLVPTNHLSFCCGRFESNCGICYIHSVVHRGWRIKQLRWSSQSMSLAGTSQLSTSLGTSRFAQLKRTSTGIGTRMSHRFSTYNMYIVYLAFGDSMFNFSILSLYPRIVNQKFNPNFTSMVVYPCTDSDPLENGP